MACATRSTKYRVQRYQKLTPAQRVKLIDQYDRLLWRFAKTALKRNGAHRNFTEDDLYQEAVILLLDAWTRFDPARGAKFITYAIHRVGRKLDAITLTAGLIRVPTSASGRCGWASDENLEHGDRANGVRFFSALDEKRNQDSWWDKLEPAAPESVPHHEVEIEALIEALRHLEPRDRRIVEMRLGFDGNGAMTLEQVGAALGISKERVRQLQRRAMTTVRSIATQLIRRRAPDSPCITPVRSAQ